MEEHHPELCAFVNNKSAWKHWCDSHNRKKCAECRSHPPIAGVKRTMDVTPTRDNGHVMEVNSIAKRQKMVDSGYAANYASLGGIDDGAWIN